MLSRAQADRSFSTDFGTKKFFRGAQIGCYSCHNGPSSESTNPNRPAVVRNATASTKVDTPVSIPLTATDAAGNVATLTLHETLAAVPFRVAATGGNVLQNVARTAGGLVLPSGNLQ